MKHTPRSIHFKNENCTKIALKRVPGRRIYTAHKEQLFLKISSVTLEQFIYFAVTFKVVID